MKNKQCPKSSTPYQSAIKANLSTDRKEVCPKMYDEKGAPITKSVTAVSKAVCQEKLEELKVKCGVVTGRAKSDMPFGEWIDLWYQTWSKPGLRITTQQCYEDRIYNHIIPHVDKIPLNKLTQSDLQQFYAELKRNGRRIRRDLYGPGLSDRMVRSCHTT